MKVLSAINVVRLIEIVLAGVIVGVYYGTWTNFANNGINRPDTIAGDNFGQFVIIGGLISATIMLIVNIIFELEKKLGFLVVIYNIIWLIFYLAAACLILKTWTGNYFRFLEEERRGGIVVGSLCLFQCALLIISSILAATVASQRVSSVAPSPK
ncbi:UNVERIFIED_CONTAM: hypothetical protein RMT77_012488 [Armadillidium vulgare]